MSIVLRAPMKRQPSFYTSLRENVESIEATAEVGDRST